MNRCTGLLQFTISISQKRGCCGHGAGPRSRELLTSGVEGLAPGEQLPSDAARVPDGLAALVTERDTPFDDRVPADLDSDEESPRASPGRQEVGLCQMQLGLEQHMPHSWRSPCQDSRSWMA